jgi:hypothetical protein
MWDTNTCVEGTYELHISCPYQPVQRFVNPRLWMPFELRSNGNDSINTANRRWRRRSGRVMAVVLKRRRRSDGSRDWRERILEHRFLRRRRSPTFVFQHLHIVMVRCSCYTPSASRVPIRLIYPGTRPMRPAEQHAAPIPDTVDEHNRVCSTRTGLKHLPNTEADLKMT